MADENDITIRQATEELLHTHIFQNIARRNNKQFAQKLAMWLVRYILIVSSMNESLHINLEQILMNLHGDRFKKIVNITDRGFDTIKKEDDDCGNYIW
jgi:diketogulonate reductase-like aldo/keto reductase